MEENKEEAINAVEVIPEKNTSLTSIEAKNKLAVHGSNMSVAELKDLMTQVHESKILPDWVTSPAKAFAVAQRGRELGMPPLTSFGLLFMVNGLVTVNAYGAGALIRANGGDYHVTKDYEPIYNLDADGKIVYSEDGYPQILDYVTEIEFSRKGSIHKDKVQFKWSEAAAAGLTTKDVWKKWPADMLYARCIGRGSRRIYPDIMQGMYLDFEIDDSLEGSNISSHQ